MKDVGSGMGVKNVCDLVLKEIYGICGAKNPSKEQVNKYKMTKREIYKKLTNLSKQELNTKNNKSPYARNDVMTTIIKRCRGEKTRGIRAIDGFRKKLMISESEIPKCSEFEVKSKKRKIFKNIIPLKNILLRFTKLILIFINIMKKIQVDKNGCKYILFRIDIYFNKFLLVVEIDKKGYTDRDLTFEEKRQEALEKKLGCKFIRINTSNAKNGYDLDYEVGNIEAFIDEFKNKKIKELEAKLKELQDKNKNATINQITNSFKKIVIKN